MSKFTSFLDNVAQGALNPKGNLGDWQHAARLFTDGDQRLAPKTKFLYHVFFEIDPVAAGILPSFSQKQRTEVGMLVKTADLPKYTAQTSVVKKYNRNKNVQTGIAYDPVNITFHDDNASLTTAMIQAYYRYYFADGNQYLDNGRAYAKTPDSTYEGPARNKYKFGMDNNNPGRPFFRSIKISQLSKKEYLTYTLVNPILTNWAHDTVNSSDGSGTMENSITVAYEAVFYDQGSISEGGINAPTGFGNTHYDVTPSPISLQGGGQLGLGGVFGGALDLYGYIARGENFTNPLQAGLAAANLIGNIRNLSSDGIRQAGFNALTDAIGRTAGIDVSGVANTFFPKNGGSGGAKDIALATVAVAGLSAISRTAQANSVANNAAAATSAMKNEFTKDYLNNGGSGVNGRSAAYANLPDTALETLNQTVLGR
jgi:hypothetical protein